MGRPHPAARIPGVRGSRPGVREPGPRGHVSRPDPAKAVLRHVVVRIGDALRRGRGRSPRPGRRGARNGLAKKLGAHLHTSASVILNDVLPTFKALFNADAELRVQIVATLGLEDGEVAYLLQEKEDSHALNHLPQSAAKIRGVADAETSRGLQGFDPG